VFEDLLVIDSLRGVDSVGVASIDTFNRTFVHKKAMYPHDYLDSKGYQRILTRVNRVLIGHNRWATKGGISNNSAHPFDFNNVVGAHNGTLRQQYLLPDSADFEIDSENIFYSIDKDGIDETYSKIAGAAALVYWDKEQLSLNFIRNSERPLFYCFEKDRKAIFWASEAWMLSGVLQRHKIEHTSIINVKEDHLYTIPMANFRANDVLDKIHIRKLRPYIYVQKKTPLPKNVGNVAILPNKGGQFDQLKKDFPVGSNVKFKYSRGHVSKKSKYVDGWLEAAPEVTVRLFLRNSTPVLKKALDKGYNHYFIGRVNGYDKDSNILVQANSVSIMDREDDKAKKEGELYIDFGGIAITKQAFDELPDKDCCWCSSPIQFEEGNTMINERTICCPDCSSQADVKFYLAHEGMN